MLWVKIKVPLENKLRKAATKGDPLAAEVLAEVEAQREKEKAKTVELREEGKISWGWIIQEFRKALGNALALPPTPSDAWVGTQVQRVRRLGLNEQQIYELCRGVVLDGRKPPYNIEYLLRDAPRYLSVYDAKGVARRNSKRVEHTGETGDTGKLETEEAVVVTGRL